MSYYSGDMKVFGMDLRYCSFNTHQDTNFLKMKGERYIIVSQPHLWGVGKWMEMCMNKVTDTVFVYTGPNGLPTAYKDVILVETGTDFLIMGEQV